MKKQMMSQTQQQMGYSKQKNENYSYKLSDLKMLDTFCFV